MANNYTWHLVARKLSGEATLDELRELEHALREDPELAYQVEQYSSFYENKPPSLRSIEQNAASWHFTKSKILSDDPEAFAIKKQATVKRFVSIKYAVAAATIVLISMIAYFFLSNRNITVPEQNVAVNEMKTMPGTRTKMVLPDGTQVWLNSDSYISYNKDFGESKREITLTGEAYFDVFHNPDVPLLVHARSVNILVKGTAFNVRNYPETEVVETALIRGSVELSTDSDPTRKILLKPNEKITIDAVPGEVVTKETGQLPVIKPSYYHIDALKESAISKTIPEISWVENKLVFDNQTFFDVARSMEKWYNVKFVVENSALAAKKFSGAFEKETLYEALSALQLINHFEFTINGNEVIIK